MLVVILYSPIGSPENYVQNSFYPENQGVSFSGKIQNASRGSKFGGNNSSPAFTSPISLSENINFSNNPTISIEDNSIEVAQPEYKSVNRNTPKYAVANTSRYSNTSSDINNTNYSVTSKGSSIISKENSSGGSIGGGMGNSGAVIIGKTSDDNNSNPQLNGFIALNSIDLTIFSDLTPKQGAGYTPGSGATDPGEDPIGEPIPVPDGFWLLLLMAIGYTAMKYFKKKPQTV